MKSNKSKQAARIAKIKFLTRDEVRRFFAVVPDRRDKAPLLLMYRRGLRASEPGILLMRDYDRKAGKLYVRRLEGPVSRLHLLQRDDLLALQMRQMMRAVVADLTEAVAECGDGDEAVAAYAAQRFSADDRVLMDLQMPRLGRLEYI